MLKHPCIVHSHCNCLAELSTVQYMCRRCRSTEHIMEQYSILSLTRFCQYSSSRQNSTRAVSTLTLLLLENILPQQNLCGQRSMLRAPLCSESYRRALITLTVCQHVGPWGTNLQPLPQSGSVYGPFPLESLKKATHKHKDHHSPSRQSQWFASSWTSFSEEGLV